MSRANRVLEPRLQRPELPDGLTPASGWQAHAEHELIRFEGLPDEVSAPGSRLVECRLADATLTKLEVRAATLVDVEICGSNVVELRANEANLRNVVVSEGRIAFLDLSGAQLDSVVLERLRVDYLSLMGADLLDCEIRDCRIGTLDLPDATCSRVRIAETEIDELTTRDARLDNVDLRTATFVRATHPTSLRGAAITSEQATTMATQLATANGIRVID